MTPQEATDLMRILSTHYPQVFSPTHPVLMTDEAPDQPGPHWQTLGDKLWNWKRGIPLPDPWPPSTVFGPVIW